MAPSRLTFVRIADRDAAIRSGIALFRPADPAPGPDVVLARRLGPVWRALPADFPPAWTVFYWAARGQASGSTEGMHDQLRERVRLLAGRKAAPVARSSRGYDGGKKVNGRKRHIAVDVTACC